MKKSFFLLSFLLLCLSFPSEALASLAPTSVQTQTPSTSSTPLTSCPPIYNGGSTCEQNKDFSIDKKILHPSTGRYVDSIEPQDLKIQTDHAAMFRIQITNLTQKTLQNITVTDMLPSYMQFSSASIQTITTTGTKVTYIIPTLEAGKTNTFTIEAKITNAASLPESTVCLANQAEATEANKRASDIVSFCIEKFEPVAKTQPQPQLPIAQPTPPNISKGGLPVYPEPQTNKAPNTGPEALAIIGLIPLAFAGFKLRSFRIS